jgi:hypothetical protein
MRNVFLRLNKCFVCLFLGISALTANVAAHSLSQEWLGCIPSNRFDALTQFAFKSLPEYQTLLVPYLIARGVDDEAIMETLVREDLFHIAQAFSVLFEQNPVIVLNNLLGEHITLIEGYHAQIDHVGRELFGPLSFYLSLLKQIAPNLRFILIRDIVFPSTQVVKVLQKHDPHLQGVTIGRVYLQDSELKQKKCIELFQASTLDEKNPQRIEATRQRLSLLTRGSDTSMVTPIDHLSIELSSIEEVHCVHNRIRERASDTLRLNQMEVSHNPGDGSTQTKALIRSSPEGPFNKIIEFVHYLK